MHVPASKWDLDLEMRSPVVEGNRATFYYLGDEARAVSVISESTEWRPAPMECSGGVWSLTRIYPHDARDEYQLAVDGEIMLDPINPFTGPGGFGPRSECRMPGYVPPRPVGPIVDGCLDRLELAGRKAGLYIPSQVEGAALLIVQDGDDYIRFACMAELLDLLIREGTIRPTVAVFVNPRDREREYRSNNEYVRWVANELVPAVEDRLPIHPGPEHRGLVGASLGGLIATYAAFRRPDAFGLIGAQSPAYRVSRTLLRELLDQTDVSRMRIHVDGGTFETRMYRRPYLPFIRLGAQAFSSRGARVQYVEVNEGHNWSNWRGRLEGMLTWLVPA